MKSKKKKKSNKLLLALITLILSVIVIGGVFLGTYYYMMNNSLVKIENEIKGFVNDINVINKKVGTFNKGQTIDPELSRRELPVQINKLLDMKPKLQKTPFPTNYKDAYTNLYEGLSNNINLYKQIQAVLQNSQNIDLQATYNELVKYKDECLNYYSLFLLKDLKIDLPKDALTYVNNASSYTLELVKAKRDADIKNNQNLEFVNKIDAVITSFTPLKTDYSAQLQKVRSGSGSFDEVLTQIQTHWDQYSDIKKSFLSISIPVVKSRAVHTSFNKVLVDYYEYIQSMKYSVTNEKAKAASGPLKTDDIKSVYSEALGKFSSMSDKFEDFYKVFSDYKSKNIK